MSVITNDPILLNETGLQIVNRLDRQNALLSMMAEGNRSGVYADITQVASIVRGNTLEENMKLFPVGDQIIIPWMDMDDSAHNTAETAYQVPLNIVHHGEVELESGEIVPGMFLQWHYCSSYGVQFSHQQAFATFPEGLPVGTYYVTFGGTWGSKGATAGTTWKFTLTQAVPAGGRLSGFESLPDVLPSAWTVKSWATSADASPIETMTVTAYDPDVDTATSLGTMNPNRLSEDGLNCMHSVGYGHNRYKTSAIRQYLNSKGTSWWKSQEDFDIRPDQYNKRGFMSGFNDDFLNAIKPVKVMTALNTVEGFTETTEDTFDRFFLPSLEQMSVKPQLAGAEGSYFEYWRRRLGLNGFASTHPAIYDGLKIPAINAQTSPHYVRLRSAYRSGAYNTWCVNASGYACYSSASYAYRFAPVCVIC